ncbi:MAG: DUF3568 family protein [Nitrospirales bacterium]|nr:DUF3568 family protein [Nitrospirales bacterium]MBA3964504.1 DUF3568 family protein [Nitrospirales bacterium]
MKPGRIYCWMKEYGVILLCVVWTMSIMSGCAVVLLGAGAGAGVAGATYVMGKLEDEVNAPVPKVQQASVAALKSLELPVDKQRGDKLAAELESETADQKKIWVSITSLTSSRSKIVIRVGLMGDEARSRQILQASHTRL